MRKIQSNLKKILQEPVMPDCRGVGESRIYSKRAKKSPFTGLDPQSGITDARQILKSRI